MIKYTQKGKVQQKLIGYPIYLVNQTNQNIKDEYIRNLLNLKETDEYSFISKPIPFYSEFNWDNQICYLVGASDKVEVCNALEFNYDKDFYKKHKYALNKLFNDKKYEIDDIIYSKQLDEIIKYIVDKMNSKYVLFNNLITELKKMINYENIASNDIEQKEGIIKQLTKLLNCKSNNANFKFLNNSYSMSFGRKDHKIISNLKLINSSSTGIYTKTTNIGD